MKEMKRERPVAACTTRMTQSFASEPEWPNQTRRSPRPGRDAQQVFRKRDGVLAGEGEQACARHTGAGVADRGRDGGMAVAEDRGSERCGQVKKLPAAFLDQVVAAATDEAERRKAQAPDVGDGPRV